MNYQRNKQAAMTKTTQPSKADQSQAKDTDINVIVGKFLQTGTAPGAGAQAMSGDFTHLPTGLRDMIEEGRRLDRHRRRLPPQLRDMSTDELLSLTPQKLREILTPPAPTPAPEGDTK